MFTHHPKLFAVVLAVIVIALPLSVLAAPTAQETTPQPEWTLDPQITDVPTEVPTEVATEVPTEVATEVPTEVPTEVLTEVPTEVPTEVVTEVPTDIATEIPTDPPVEPTAEPIPTIAPEVTETPVLDPVLVIESICGADGVVFTVSNLGGPMTGPSTYLLALDGELVTPTEPVVTEAEAVETPAPVGDEDTAIDETTTDADTDANTPEVTPEPSDEVTSAVDGSATETPAPETTPEPEPISTEVTPEAPVAQVWPHEFTLAPAESFSVAAGFGLPTLYVDSIVGQPSSPCLPPPVLTISAVCVFETGVTFTVANTGGPMLEPLAYSITPNLDISPEASTQAGDFTLSPDTQVTFEAGHGLPTFSAGELSSTLTEPCWRPAEVYGSVWEDTNADGILSDGDAPLANITVSLLDSAGFSLPVVTAADGSYRFSLLRTGSYTIQVDTAALSADLVPLVAASSPVDVLQGRDSEISFGFSVNGAASISGAVWMDVSNWGSRDAGEPAVFTALVDLLDANGAVIATTAVDPASGAYTFVNLREGAYVVRLVEGSLFAPYMISFDADGDRNLESPVTLTHAQAAVGVDFGVVGTN